MGMGGLINPMASPERRRGHDHSLQVGCRGNGALGVENLERVSHHDLFEELEHWEHYLRSDPELVKALRLLANSKEGDAKSNTSAAPKLRRPRP